MPSSSLVEVEIEVGVVVEVDIGSGFLLFRLGGWVGGWGGWRSQI